MSMSPGPIPVPEEKDKKYDPDLKEPDFDAGPLYLNKFGIPLKAFQQPVIDERSLQFVDQIMGYFERGKEEKRKLAEDNETKLKLQKSGVISKKSKESEIKEWKEEWRFVILMAIDEKKVCHLRLHPSLNPEPSPQEIELANKIFYPHKVLIANIITTGVVHLQARALLISEAKKTRDLSTDFLLNPKLIWLGASCTIYSDGRIELVNRSQLNEFCYQFNEFVFFCRVLHKQYSNYDPEKKCFPTSRKMVDIYDEVRSLPPEVTEALSISLPRLLKKRNSRIGACTYSCPAQTRAQEYWLSVKHNHKLEIAQDLIAALYGWAGLARCKKSIFWISFSDHQMIGSSLKLLERLDIHDKIKLLNDPKPQIKSAVDGSLVNAIPKLNVSLIELAYYQVGTAEEGGVESKEEKVERLKTVALLIAHGVHYKKLFRQIIEKNEIENLMQILVFLSILSSQKFLTPIVTYFIEQLRALPPSDSYNNKKLLSIAIEKEENNLLLVLISTLGEISDDDKREALLLAKEKNNAFALVELSRRNQAHSSIIESLEMKRGDAKVVLENAALWNNSDKEYHHIFKKPYWITILTHAPYLRELKKHALDTNNFDQFSIYMATLPPEITRDAIFDYLEVCFRQSITNGDRTSAQAILEHMARNDLSGSSTPAHLAIKYDFTDVIYFCNKRYFAKDIRHDGVGNPFSPAHWAIKYKNAEAVKYLFGQDLDNGNFAAYSAGILEDLSIFKVFMDTKPSAIFVRAGKATYSPFEIILADILSLEGSPYCKNPQDPYIYLAYLAIKVSDKDFDSCKYIFEEKESPIHLNKQELMSGLVASIYDLNYREQINLLTSVASRSNALGCILISWWRPSKDVYYLEIQARIEKLKQALAEEESKESDAKESPPLT